MQQEAQQNREQALGPAGIAGSDETPAQDQVPHGGLIP